MNILYGFLVVLEVLVSFLLIGIILLQKSKGGGFAGIGMASAVGENLFGSRAGNILTKTTVVLASIFLVNTLVMAKIQASGQDRSILDAAGTLGVMREVPDEPPPELREIEDEPEAEPAARPEDETDVETSEVLVAPEDAGAPPAPPAPEAVPDADDDQP